MYSSSSSDTVKLNKTQIQILGHLTQRKYESVTDFSQNFGSGVSNIDMALKTLLDLGFVTIHKKLKDFTNESLITELLRRGVKQIIWEHEDPPDCCGG